MEKHFKDAVDLLFEEQIQLTDVVEYGISWTDLCTGKAMLPSAGARFDLSFEGTVYGEVLNGKIRGTDYLEVRADGRFMLNIQATIITDDGEAIALHEFGTMAPQPGDPIADLYLTLQFTTHSRKYAWLNKANAWAIGRVYMNEGKVAVEAFTGNKLRQLQLHQ
jgi:hypothetical protein